MNRALALFVIGLVFGGGLGFAFAAASGAAFEPHDHGDPAQHAISSGEEQTHDTAHATPIELGAEDLSELVDLAVEPDPVSGWNLHVITDGFDFAPERAGKDHVAGEGHAHVYVNDRKVARLYGAWMHIDDLPQGQVDIEVTLTSNDHRPLLRDGAPLSASRQVTVK